jgi:ABC-type transport system involved in multi-copper enzyme maturation permease subunit
VARSEPRASGGTWVGPAVGLLTLALFGAGSVWTVSSFVAIDENVSSATNDAAAALAEVSLVVAMILLAAELGAILAAGGVRAVARYTFLQCVRMRMAAVFVALLTLSLLTLPFLMEGDGTLAGRIRTLLSYGCGATGVLLSLMTIFVACSVVSSDVETKNIFTVAVKPLARWEYIVGRWLGLVLFNAVMLAIAGVVIFAFAQYLRGRTDLVVDPSDAGAAAGDIRAVETEVLTARRKVRPIPVDTKTDLARWIAKQKAQGRYEDALEAHTMRAGGNVNKGRRRLEEEGLKAVNQARHSVGPGGAMTWEFKGIDVSDTDYRAEGTVTNLDRTARMIRIRTDAKLVGRLAHRGPVRVQGVEGRVVNRGRVYFDTLFSVEDMQRPELAALRTGSVADLAADRLVQLTFRISPSRMPLDEQIYSFWVVENPTTGFSFAETRQDKAGGTATMIVPARVIDSQGRTVVRYLNYPHGKTGEQTSVTILRRDVAILYRVGGFEANFVRGMMLILIQLMFLAAMAVMFGSFCSFPVACVACFFILPFSLAREWLTEALRLPLQNWESALDVITWVGHYVLTVMGTLLPDFANTSPGDSFINGMQVAWRDLARVGSLALAVQTLLILTIAFLIFRKRELARVQV